MLKCYNVIAKTNEKRTMKNMEPATCNPEPATCNLQTKKCNLKL